MLSYVRPSFNVISQDFAHYSRSDKFLLFRALDKQTAIASIHITNNRASNYDAAQFHHASFDDLIAHTDF